MRVRLTVTDAGGRTDVWEGDAPRPPTLGRAFAVNGFQTAEVVRESGRGDGVFVTVAGETCRVEILDRVWRAVGKGAGQ